MKARAKSWVVFAVLAALSFLAASTTEKVEACYTCQDGFCTSGGDGIECHSHHWANGSSLCWYIDGCVY